MHEARMTIGSNSSGLLDGVLASFATHRMHASGVNFAAHIDANSTLVTRKIAARALSSICRGIRMLLLGAFAPREWRHISTNRLIGNLSLNTPS